MSYIKSINGDYMRKDNLKKRIIPFLLLIILSGLLTGCFGAKSTGDDAKTGNTSGITEKTDGDNQQETDLNLVISPLTGEEVPQDKINRRSLAVMIENAPAARPQSGLDKADIVYEILAEGGLTRFMAIFLQNDTGMLGPVRSARPYFIERMFEYDAMYAFCGGSPAALDMVKNERVASLNEFGVGKKAYWRIKDRKAPHNLYTDTEKLRKVGAQKGYEKSPNLPELEFLSKGEENEGGVTAQQVVIGYPTKYSLVKWEYDPANMLYKRSEGGKVHRDAVTGKQLTASNIIVQYVRSSTIDTVGRLEFSMVGRGRSVLFTGGKAYTGTWLKLGTKKQTYFYGENGEVLKLNPGQTWIEVVPTSTKVEY